MKVKEKQEIVRGGSCKTSFLFFGKTKVGHISYYRNISVGFRIVKDKKC